MGYWRGMGAAAAICSVTIMGCSAEQERADDVVEATNAPPSTAASQTEAVAPSALQATPAALSKFFSRMDSVGAGSEAAYAEALKEFHDSPTALTDLKSFYKKLPQTASGTRWKSVYAAGLIQSAESVEFLEEIAMAPPEPVPSPQADEPGDDGFRLRYTAAIGIVRHLVAGVGGSVAAVDRLLAGAEPGIASLVGVELFSAGKLNDAQRERLGARGIFNKFRKMTDAEVAEMRTVDPSKDGHQGSDVRKRARVTSTPPASE